MKKRVMLVAIGGMLIVAALLLGLYVAKQRVEEAAPLLATTIAAETGIDVRIGSLEVTNPTTITLHNILVYDKQGKKIADGPLVNVSYSLWSLLTKPEPIAAINRVEVVKPVIALEQSAAGRWNVEDLRQGDSTTSSAFAGEIVFSEGQADVTAYNHAYVLTALAGKVDFSAAPRADIKLSGRFNDAAVRVEGFLGSSQGSMLTAWLDSLAVAELRDLLPANAALQVESGEVQKLQFVWKKAQGKTTISGMAALRGGAVVVNGTAAADINGDLAFNSDAIYLFAMHTKIYQQPIVLEGKIDWSPSVPLLNLRVSSPGTELSALPFLANAQGTATFSAAVTGSTASPKIDGQLSLAQGSIAGWEIKDGRVAVQVADSLLTIKQAAAGVLGGRITGSGQINLASGVYEVRANGQQVAVDVLSRGQVSGVADFSVSAAGQRVPQTWQELDFRGNIHMPQADVSGVRITNVAVGFNKQGTQFQLDYLNANLNKGTLTANVQGDIAGGPLFGTVYGNNLPLAELGATSDMLALQGTADFSGQLAGSFAAPQLNLAFSAHEGKVLQQPYSEVSGKLLLTPEQVVLQQIAAADAGGATHRLTGTIGLRGEQAVDVELTTHKARAENLVALLLPGERLTGNVDNRIHITGSRQNLNAEGYLRLTDGSFRGQLLARAEGSYQHHNGITTVDKMLIDSLNTKISVSGVVQPDKQLNFAVEAQNIDLGKLHINYPYPVQGQGRFVGTLTGSAVSPVFNGRLTTPELMLNYRSLENFDAEISYQNDQLAISGLTFKQEGGSYDFHGGVDLNTLEVFGGVDVVNGRLPAILDIANSPFKEADGLLNGHIRVGGILTHMDIWLNGTIQNGKFKNYSLENIDLDAELVNNKLTVHTLTAKQGAGMFAARGHAYMNGPIDFEVGARDMDAGILSILLDTETQLQGNLDFAAQVAGTTTTPRVDMSLEVRNGKWETATFDSLYGLFNMDQAGININQLMLIKGPYQASAYGTVPLAALQNGPQPHNEKAREMSVDVRLDKANLSILPMLTKYVAWAQGETKGAVHIGGTMAKPTINGDIVVNDGIVKPSFLQEPIQHVNINIACNDQAVSINRFSGQMGTGSYLLTGTAALEGATLANYNLNAEFAKPVINSKYFKGPLEGNLALTNENGHPKLSGRMIVQDATIDIPLIPELQPSDTVLGLDVRVEAGKKVRLYNPYLYDMFVGGRVTFGGTVQQPAPDGRFFVHHGTVSYLQTKFKIREGRAEFNPMTGLLPTLSVAAETKLQNTTVNLLVNGPVNQMNIQLTSSPSMSQADILSLLTLRSRFLNKQNGGSSSSSDDWMSLLDSGLQMSFVSEVENIFRSALGLDEFHVVRDTFSTSASSVGSTGSSSSTLQASSAVSKEGYNLEFGKYITDRFMVNYTIGVDHSAYKWDARYDLNRRISLTGKVIGGRDATPDQVIGLEARFKF